MKNNTYDFDPCSIDGSDIENEITLDNWKPNLKTNNIVQSEWRKTQIGNNFNQNPGLDDLKKINMYRKKKCSDAEIMQVFGINAETLIAIKDNRYCPIDGISLDNLSKISNKFIFIEKSIRKMQLAIDFMSTILFDDEKKLNLFKDYCKKTDNNSKKNESEEVKEEE